jgi:hypothetical protein
VVGYFKLALIRRKVNEHDFDKKIYSKTNDKKLLNNLSRASTKIFEIALCNDWNFFFTGTISPEKYDRSNFDVFYKDFSKWLSNYNYKNNYSIKYLIIPELHVDKKNWHMHGLIANLPREILKINKFGYLDWQDYSEKFGYCSFADVYDNKGISLYVTKYIRKDVFDSSLQIGKHSYYCSKGLKRAVKIFEGNITSEKSLSFDFENDFCKIKTFDSEEQMKEYFKNSQFIEKI